MRNRSLNRWSLFLFVTLLLCSGALQAQWLPNNAQQNQTIYRSGSVGVNTGSTVPNMLSVKNGSSMDGVSIDGTNPALILLNSSPLGYFGAVTVANAFFTGTAVNDIALRSQGGKIHFGVGTGSGAPAMTIEGSNVGIGATHPTSPLYVYKQNTSAVADTEVALEGDMQLNPSAAQGSNTYRIAVDGYAYLKNTNGATTNNGVGTMTGVEGDAENYLPGTIGSMNGVSGWAYNDNASGNVTRLAGLNSGVESDGGTITNMNGLMAWLGVYGGTVQNLYGVQVSSNIGGGTITNDYGIFSAPWGNATNKYGLYLANVTGTATNDYGVYQEGATHRNYFGGPVSIGNTGGAYGFNVFGAAAITLGPDQSVPRWVTYDDGSNASYTTYSADTSTQYKSTGAFAWKNVPYGSTRMNATGTQTMFLDQAGNLIVQGQVISSTGGYRFPDGSVQTTAITGGGGGSVQATNIGAGAFGACCNGGNFSFPARLGVGTTTPGASLDVAAGVTARSSDTDLLIGSALPQVELYRPEGSATINYDGTALNFFASGTRVLTLNNSANVGFGPLSAAPKALISLPNGVGAGQQVGFLHNAGSLANKPGLYFGTNGTFNGTSATAYFGITAAPTSHESDFALVGSSDPNTHRNLLIGYNTNDDPSLTFNPQVTIDTFNGNITTSGTITGARVINAVFQDVAEWVPTTETLAPGTVVVLNPAKGSEVQPSAVAYDTTVAGVVSEHPGIVLGKAAADKAQIATTGRVRVKVDATHNPIHVGDLLVTSDVGGTAMRSVPVSVGGISIHRPGTIIGKALEPLEDGTGEILVLLSLQ